MNQEYIRNFVIIAHMDCRDSLYSKSLLETQRFQHFRHGEIAVSPTHFPINMGDNFINE